LRGVVNRSLHIHFVRVLIAVIFLSVGFVVEQTVLKLLSFAFSITSTGIANLEALSVNTSKTFRVSVKRLASNQVCSPPASLVVCEIMKARARYCV